MTGGGKKTEAFRTAHAGGKGKGGRLLPFPCRDCYHEEHLQGTR